MTDTMFAHNTIETTDNHTCPATACGYDLEGEDNELMMVAKMYDREVEDRGVSGNTCSEAVAEAAWADAVEAFEERYEDTLFSSVKHARALKMAVSVADELGWDIKSGYVMRIE